MDIRTLDHPGDFTLYEIVEGSDRYVLSTFGAQIWGWSRGETSVVFENAEKAIRDGSAPFRGGAPICFPYFGRGTLLPHGTTLPVQHGAARTTVWESEIDPTTGTVTLQSQFAAPAEYGDGQFQIALTYTFRDGLAIEARIQNVGADAAPFQLAVHTYWNCENPSNVTVTGLGERFLDNLSGLSETVDPAPDAPHPAPYDRVYLDASETLSLQTEAYQLEITTEGGHGAVLWNPGDAHTIGDLGTPSFVCVENGVIAPPQVLEPGQSYRLAARYRLV